MANTNRKICKTLPKQTFDYHSRKCVICRHPDRAAIESASRPSKKDRRTRLPLAQIHPRKPLVCVGATLGTPQPALIHLSEQATLERVLAVAEARTANLCRRTEDTPFFEPDVLTKNQRRPSLTFSRIPVAAFRAC